MSNNRWKYYLLPLFVVMLMGVACRADSCGEDTRHLVSIAHLKSLCQGDGAVVTDECYIHGVVIANDWKGEYYKSIVVADESGAIEIAIESERINLWLPIFSEVEIICSNLALARVGGKVELGALPTGDFLLDNIEEGVAQRIIKQFGQVGGFDPPKCGVAEIQPSDIGNAVLIENLRVVDSEQGLAWCDIVDGEAQTTMRTLVDAEGYTLPVRTLPTCTYATQKIPSTALALVGVVEAADGEYFLRIINGTILPN